MTDEEFLFRQTERERKRNGRGDFSKKRQGGRHVRLPSDNMSAKERKAMNGECRSYPLNSPVKWAEFRVWPDDIKREYINGLRARYGATTSQLCEMFGCAKPTMWKHLRGIGVEFENLCPNVKNGSSGRRSSGESRTCPLPRRRPRRSLKHQRSSGWSWKTRSGRSWQTSKPS